ncbi:MAG: hypothetical protein ACI4SF_10295 [Oscillospiraceae bacterium]
MAEKIQSLLSDEESMQQIRELAAMFGSSSDASAQPQQPCKENPPQTAEEEPLINPAALMSLMSGLSKNDKNCELLIALKPLLSADKQPRVDKAIKLLRLFNVYTELKASGALGNIF